MTEPFWHRAIEEQGRQLAGLAKHRDLWATNAGYDDPAEGFRAWSWVLRAFHSADCYAWQPWTWEAVSEAAKSVPREAMSPAASLLGTAGWWWVDAGAAGWMAILWMCAPGDGSAGEQAGSQTVFFSSFFRGCTGENAGKPYMTFAWCAGETIAQAEARLVRELQSDDVYLRETEVQRRVRVSSIGRTMQLFAAAAAWLHQRVFTLERQPVERHLRKRLSRECGLDATKGVQVITLRRAEQTAGDDPAQPPGSRDWSCRWLVRGHWRNHACKDGHRLLYVMPFIKGPKDKPLRLYEKTVFAVTR